MIKLGIIGQPLSIISHLPASDHLNEITWTGFFSENACEPEGFIPLMCNIRNAEHLVSSSDALIISESKSEYYNLAVMALKHARHLFLPVTLVQTVAEANKLIKLANEANVILKVHKPGIFPPDFKKQFAFNGEIWLIELHHYARVTEDNPGKSLFYNLLHNLDFILGLTRSNVVSMKATGLNMLSPGVDIINARIDFDNGCSATMTCNCASVRDEHVGTIVLKDKIMRVDFIREDAVVWNVTRSDQINGTITTDKISFQHGNDLTESLLSFIALLNDKNRLLLNSEDGFKSFILATKIMDRVNRNTVRTA
jgi:predicted dehydrogenase